MTAAQHRQIVRLQLRFGLSVAQAQAIAALAWGRAA